MSHENKTILLVEDEPAVRRLCAAALRSAGYAVLEAADAAAGEQLAADSRGRIDLLMTDIDLPDVSGPRLAAQLHRDRPTLRVLYMTGYPAEQVEAAVTGVFLEKPFEVSALQDAVRAALAAG